MASSVITVITGLMLVMFCGRVTVGENDHESYQSSLSSRIDNQTRILKHISDASDKLAKDIGEIKTGVVDDIPSQLESQALTLEALKTSVDSTIPAKLETQSTELNKIKASISNLAISLNKHSEELNVHDGRLREQGQLLEQLNNLVKEIHISLVGPKDCSDIKALGHSASGVYRVYPGSLAKRIQADIYCDMTTPGGNWLVFQRRKDGSVNFERTWNEYLNGFGNQTGEFWLGNELLYLLTSNGNYKLRIDMEDFEGTKRYAEYSTFLVKSSADNYRLTVSGYTGDAGDSFSHHSGMQFSTKDADNDIHETESCSLLFRGGWWYSNCHGSNLNGLYLGGPHESYADGIEWNAFHGYYYSLKTTEMKITAVN